MNIGDKVRVIHGTEEGIIVRKLPDGLVEIEIEDGFTIPVLTKDVVVIQPGFQDVRETKSDSKPLASVQSHTGLYLGVNIKAKDMVEVFFINNTDQTLLLAAGKTIDKDYKGLISEKIKARSYFKLDQTTFQKLVDGKYLFEFIIHDPSNNSLPEITSKTYNPKPTHFQKNKTNAPLINSEMHLIQLDTVLVKINPDELKDSLIEKREMLEVENKRAAVAQEVDLHIETLTDDHEFLNSEEMLRLQLATFEKTLDNAIAYGMDQITFIHGVGNGKLRMEIHRLLSKNEQIEWFKDAAKERFGYGATLVKIK